MTSALNLVENISALTVAILRNDVECAEEAFDMLHKPKRMLNKSDVKIEVMLDLRNQEYTFNEIGIAVNLNRGTVYRRLKRYHFKNPHAYVYGFTGDKQAN